MAEFCLACWNKINGTNDSESRYIISKDLDLCEGCGEWKRVIVMERKAYYTYQSRCFIFLLKLIYHVACFLWRLLKLPCFTVAYYRSKQEQKE